MNPVAPEERLTLVDRMLAEQSLLTPVERFARLYENSELPAQARYFRELMPLGKPAPGEQYAFSVALDRCTGCKACVSACHSLNGLDEHETWRSAGLVHGGTVAEPYQQVVTTACHHCLDPACLNGCPVLAYEKDSATGIVRHLDDQCIGCQYCVLKCPYDVPKYSAKRGIVRKCDLCYTRLAAQEAPACVQACPSQAITIQLVNQTDAARRAAQPDCTLVPGAFSSGYTLPTTSYTSRLPWPANVAPADHHVLRLEQPHWPLIWMLVLTQLATGLFLATSMLAVADPVAFAQAQVSLSVCGGLSLHIGLASSVFHLGRPLGAWRAFLGWRRSWMSREILVFGCLAIAASAFCGAACLPVRGWVPVLLSGLTTVFGLVAVMCSAMIYADTCRPFWKACSTIPKFLGTTLLLGAAGLCVVLGWWAEKNVAAIQLAAWTATLVRTGLFVWDVLSLARMVSNPDHVNRRSGLVIWRRRKSLVRCRAVLFVLSTLFGLLAITASGSTAACWATASFILTFGSQLIDRYFFFVAVTAPRMPGGLAP